MRVILKFTNLKQQIIAGLKKKLLLVELPGYVKEFTLGGKSRIVWDNDIVTKVCYGKLTDITESQFAELVDKFNHGAYRDYKDKNSFYPDADTDNFFLAARVSFFSKLEADGIYFENPLGDCPPKITETEDDVFGMVSALRSQRIGKWREAELKVWNLSRTYLFEILN